ncbi:type VI secretion system Vgr family protein [Ectothiorhodospira variabilis]|uniref:type VI secretion system Vgr family protein n=1 Tax=Ectothiorhodospira variabilis TaxID=505694 RepID=UPI001EFAD29E|nr:type VI secretion system tip protein TssI/VgrG [Ectothiorhodospira variabilis]MCG5494986.1 type VI secretion system tip protein VgrG [Ectothiorhodospira variabilis]MCG5504499.1 type VI secretion system tip protein VgrG [Ectothiorhodospira variabilis]MCG5507635.1 type VI secretion system tip protein VgrG [Ectothiorhodospira variabilis]
MNLMTRRPRLRLELPGRGGEHLTVLDFSSQGFALSRSYRLDVRCHSHSPWVASEILGQAACLCLDRGTTAPRIHGLVTALDQSPGATGKGVIQHIRLESPLAPLARTRQNRVFPGMGVRAVVEEVLQGHGWTPAQWRMACRDDDPVEDLIVQVEESDLAFMTRLMAFHGLFYRFEQSRQGATLVIHDDARDLPEAPVRRLPYHAHSGQHAPADIVYRLEPRSRLMPAAVDLRDHCPDHPQVVLHARQACKQPSHGIEEHWGAGFGTPGQGEQLARMRAEALDTQGFSFSAWTGHRGLTPGQRITLTGHPHPDFNQTYTITALQIRGEQASSLPEGAPTPGPAFSTRIELIPSTQSYRPPLKPHRSSARFVARIDGPEGESVHLDAQGRYRIRFDFDSREHPPGQASHPVRMLTPYAGDDFGFHFPLHAGTEVLVAFENNDPHRPIILGALPNADHPSPVTAHNRHQNLLRTHGGNELLMDDQPQGPRVRLSTRDHGLRLLMDATPEDPHLALHADDGRMLWQAGQALSIQTGGDQILEVGGDQRVNVQGASSLETREGSLQLSSGEDLRIQAGGDVHLEAAQGDLEQRSQGAMDLKAGRGMRLEVRQGDLECHVASGRLAMWAGGRVTLQSQSGEIHIGHANAGIRLTPRGELVIQGREVRIEAETIRVQGDGITHNGG